MRRETTRRSIRRPSPALVVATVALLFSLTGTVVGAKSLLTGRDIANGSLTGVDVRNKSLTPKDFKGSVRGAPGAAGARGDRGDRGDKGDPGPRGASGPSNWVVVREVSGAVQAFASPSLTGTTVHRRPGRPAGVFCIDFPADAQVSRAGTTASVEAVDETGTPSFVTVTVARGDVCTIDFPGADAVVQTYDFAGNHVDRVFQVVVPGRD